MALRRGGGKVSYLVNGDGTEVDFHIHDRTSHRERLVQVSYTMSDAMTFAREMNALKLACEVTGIHDCTVVAWDDEDEIDGIRILPVWKWLLAWSPAPQAHSDSPNSLNGMDFSSFVRLI